MKYIHFYATAADVLPVLRRIENGRLLKYVQTGKRMTIHRPIFLSCTDIPNIGISSSPTGSNSITYMVSPREIKNTMYEFQNEEGQLRWLLANGDNPDSVLLTMAGLWKSSILLPGKMTTLHETSNAQQIMKQYLAALKAERFKKFGVYWFGTGAIEMLKAGRRLVQAEQSPSSFDVPPPHLWDLQ